MANKLYGEARASLADGRELTLRFDFNALIEAEEASGSSTDEILKGLNNGSPRLKIARAMLYGSLRHHHPEISLEDTGELFMIDGGEVSKAMGEAMDAMAARKAELNPQKGPGKSPKARPLGIGTPSSKRGARQG